ncbi:MAG: hypothetical protein QOH41_2117 [Blastocatellia bacterium]|jgi:hypothetical protein|nr:hypothetical protein [Blastocatellia bacterium]
MDWLSRKPTQEKYVEAAVTVASNLYLHTIPGAEDARADLQFNLRDSRYRYLIFCLSAVATATLAYDEKKQVQPEALLKGCLFFATWIASENGQEYFDDPATAEVSASNAAAIFQEFLEHWSRWPTLEKEGRNDEIIDLICSMIHTTESNEPTVQTDIERLGPLALQIDCQLPTMREALVELANR